MSPAFLFALIKLALSITDKIVNYVREKQLLDAGRQTEITDALARIAASAKIARQVEEAVSKLSDTDLDDELNKDSRG